MRNNFIRVLLEHAKIDKNIILITGDLGYSILDEFRNTLPAQFINAGVSEQNMLSVAAGLALSGKKVFVYSIGNFPTLRPVEQIRNDVCYHNADVKIIALGAGFAYGSLGMTHHATEDISIMRALPDMEVLTPGDITETIAAAEYVCNKKGPCYIRLGRGGEAKFHDEKCNYAESKAVLVREGTNKDCVVLTCGAILAEAIKAFELCTDAKIAQPSIYSFISTKPIDNELICRLLNKYKKLITVEEHNIIGGFGSAVAEVMSGMRHNAVLKRFGLKDTFSSIVGSQEYLRQVYGMDAKSIFEEILKNE